MVHAKACLPLQANDTYSLRRIVKVSKSVNITQNNCMFIDSSLAFNKSMFVSVNTETLSVMCNNMQLKHSFEFHIRICQPETSDICRGKADGNTTFDY